MQGASSATERHGAVVTSSQGAGEKVVSRQESVVSSADAGTRATTRESRVVVIETASTLVRVTDEKVELRERGPTTQVATTQESRLATSQPSVSTRSEGPVEIVRVEGPKVTGNGNMAVNGNTASFKAAAVDWVAKNSSWIYPLLAFAWGLLGVASIYWLKNPIVSIVLFVLAGSFAAMPWLGWWLALVLGIGVLALAGLAGWWLMRRDNNAWLATLPGFAKLVKEGKPEEAVAAMRSDADVNAAFEEVAMKPELRNQNNEPMTKPK
jgi:hypothetical protein